MKSYETLFNGKGYLNNSCCEVINGNNIDMDLCTDDCEIRADIVVSKANTVRVWGQVKDCDDGPVVNALVKLVRPVNMGDKIEYEGVSHTLTDCSGFYQFDVEACQTDVKYKILVGKSTASNERKVCNTGNCNHGNTCKVNKSCPPCPPISQCPPMQPCQPCVPQCVKNSDMQRSNIDHCHEPIHKQYYSENSNNGNIFRKPE